MSREMCYRCFWPKTLCWCASLHPMPTCTRFLFLMHPKEFKGEKAGTGRLTQLSLPNSELHMGTGFDGCTRVQHVLNDPQSFSVLLYPGVTAVNLSEGAQWADFKVRLGKRRLVVVLLDATWSGARKMLRLSPSLQRLPRIMFTPQAPSRYVIKQQPQAGCLSTLEAVHELLTVLEKVELDRYERPAQLLDLFKRMQDFQIQCAADPGRAGYRRQPYSDPANRGRAAGERNSRRDNYFRKPAGLPDPK